VVSLRCVLMFDSFLSPLVSFITAVASCLLVTMVRAVVMPTMYSGVPPAFWVWIEVPCARLVEMAQLADSVLYCPFVYPVLQVQ
jgi:hypothetical protein